MATRQDILQIIETITRPGARVGPEHLGVEQARQVFEDKNTVGVGYGYKIKGKSTVTDMESLILFVEKKKPSHRLRLGEAMPPALVHQGVAIPTDIYETGPVEPQPLVTRSPLQPGYSIGHIKVSAGTLGTVVKRGRAFELLSNSHVLADSSRGKKGDLILYPGKADGGKPKDAVGKLSRFRKFKTTGETVDCATASVDKAKLKILRSDIKNLGVPKGVVPLKSVKPGLVVTKTGRTTATTTGKVIATDATLKINYGANVGEVAFVKQIACTRYTKPGDSGSLVLDKKSKKAVGLHFAGGPNGSFCNPIELVLKSLGVTLVTAPIKASRPAGRKKPALKGRKKR